MSLDEVMLASSFELYRAAALNIPINLTADMHQFLETLDVFTEEATQLVAEFDEKHGIGNPSRLR